MTSPLNPAKSANVAVYANADQNASSNGGRVDSSVSVFITTAPRISLYSATADATDSGTFHTDGAVRQGLISYSFDGNVSPGGIGFAAFDVNDGSDQHDYNGVDCQNGCSLADQPILLGAPLHVFDRSSIRSQIAGAFSMGGLLQFQLFELDGTSVPVFSDASSILEPASLPLSALFLASFFVYAKRRFRRD